MTTARSDRYQLVRRLPGVSRFQTFEAQHPRRPGRFLVEVCTGIRAKDAGLAAYERVVAALAKLRHPFLIQVEEISALPDGTPVIVSELPEGQTLQAWLKAGNTASPELVAQLIAALAEALTAAHSRGVCHGAISPDDIILVQGTSVTFGLPKLQGFGRTDLQPVASDERLMRAAGAATDGPTQARAATPTPAQDLAALGGLAERLLSPPELGETRAERGFALGPTVADVLARASGTGDGDRFASAGEFAAALTAAVRTQARDWGGAGGPTAAVRRDEPVRDRRGFVGVGIGVGTVAALAVVTLFATNGHERLLRVWSGGDGSDGPGRARAAAVTAPTPAHAEVPVPRVDPMVASGDGAADGSPRTATADLVSVAPTLGTPWALPGGQRPASGEIDDAVVAVRAPEGAREAAAPAPAEAARDGERAVRGLIWSPSRGRLVRVDGQGTVVDVLPSGAQGVASAADGVAP